MVAPSASLNHIPTKPHSSNGGLPTRKVTSVISNGDAVDIHYQHVRSLLAVLQELASFHPTEETNAVFTDLVDFVVKTQLSKPDLYKLMQMPNMDAICEEIRMMCAKAETLLEEYWSKRLTIGESLLSDFPYVTNYHNLMEYHLLCGQGARPQHVMFIGSGPLPLSSLTLASQHIAKDWPNGDWSVLNVDLCPRANQSGSDFAKTIFPRLMDNIRFMEGDAAQIDAAFVSKVDVIYLAALVGLDMQSKRDIVHNLVMHMKPGARLLTRSVTGLRRLLYPDVDETALLEASKGQLDLEVVCHPRNFVINSVVIARRI